MTAERLKTIRDEYERRSARSLRLTYLDGTNDQKQNRRPEEPRLVRRHRHAEARRHRCRSEPHRQATRERRQTCYSRHDRRNLLTVLHDVDSYAWAHPRLRWSGRLVPSQTRVRDRMLRGGHAVCGGTRGVP